MMRTFKIYSLSSVQTQTPALLTGIMYCIESPGFIIHLAVLGLSISIWYSTLLDGLRGVLVPCPAIEPGAPSSGSAESQPLAHQGSPRTDFTAGSVHL